MNIIVCPDCKGTENVTDYAAGDVVCIECGLVLESHYVDNAPEWRTFVDGAKDRDQVGDSYNDLLPDGGISTTLRHVKGKSISSSLERAESRVPDGNTSRLLSRFARCASMASRLGLVPSIQTRASEYYEKVTNLNLAKGKYQDAGLVCCLYFACRQEGITRSLQEICSVAEGTSRREVAKTLFRILKHMKKDLGLGRSINATEFVSRFCSLLELDCIAKLAATEIVLMADNRLDLRRKPSSVAATAIFMVTHLQEAGKRSIEEIIRVSGVCRVTICDTYVEFRRHASMIIPAWFASHEQLRDLPPPRPKRRFAKLTKGKLESASPSTTTPLST
ncbi:transcription initiation factor TFIIB [Marchantia polymorpha subsp. ruderalis]|uniref:TFIIB-type domain-containing protein n=2 Tax=Marchantia polymorpha TaxID=3197 RepID=A0AAF6BNY7_MARPO|nr:hypothetical protein MARPO_0097s0063 [Marchantia polymorpha]BBN13721.1 hypothetical protein Mp_6g05790 [Marchantia polymorpha subsp. ruderalis]|eukprot:PTQ32588.1 hypothetical protein MARPO_0097s0063 [Marchantia polymorpha]